MGQVESVTDDMGGGRIKVRLTEDKDRALTELPYALPLNPKMFQCVPKIGEGVLVITSQSGNIDSQRYYIGPIVSQGQEMSFAPYAYGKGASISLAQGAIVGPHKPLSFFTATEGAFPDKEDVAIIGRKSEDVILKEGEIDLRCGVRNEALGNEDRDLIGNVIFNGKNPTYIQLKHKPHLTTAGDGVINLVADRINLVSHNDKTLDVKLANPNSKNGSKTEPLIKGEDMDTLISELHQLPYGDKLVEVLTHMANAITNHTHPAVSAPPCEGIWVSLVKAEDYNRILSPHIRIS